VIIEIPDDKINELVKKSLLEQIQAAKISHFTKIKFRIGGEWIEDEADWIKYMEIKEE